MLGSIQVILWAQRLGNMFLQWYFIQISPFKSEKKKPVLQMLTFLAFFFFYNWLQDSVLDVIKHGEKDLLQGKFYSVSPCCEMVLLEIVLICFFLFWGFVLYSYQHQCNWYSANPLIHIHAHTHTINLRVYGSAIYFSINWTVQNPLAHQWNHPLWIGFA